jgi:hypothetical protein
VKITGSTLVEVFPKNEAIQDQTCGPNKGSPCWIDLSTNGGPLTRVRIGDAQHVRRLVGPLSRSTIRGSGGHGLN